MARTKNCHPNTVLNYSANSRPVLTRTVSAIRVWNGLKSKQGWKLTLENCDRSMKWKEPVVNRMWSDLIKRRANIFFMIVQRKVLKAAGVFVTTARRGSR